jgi:hypothetical protein
MAQDPVELDSKILGVELKSELPSCDPHLESLILGVELKSELTD